MDRQQPEPFAIADFDTGMQIISHLPLANPAAAEIEIDAFLDCLYARPPAVQDYFTLLEQTRVPLAYVEEELSRRYQGRALPLGSLEEQAFVNVVEGWNKMGRAYAQIVGLLPPEDDEPVRLRNIATVLQRCLHYYGRVIHEHYSARRELPEGLWTELHGYYATAEEWKVTELPIGDLLEGEEYTTHCMATYVTALLLDVANPYSLSTHDLALVRRWACHWAPLVQIQALDSGSGTPPYVINLLGDCGLQIPSKLELDPENVRQLDTIRLATQVQHMRLQLKQKISPTQLGLGQEKPGHVNRLLERLSRPWAQECVARKFRRFEASGHAQVCVGVDAMHYFITGREFTQPDTARVYTRNEFNRIATFGQRIDPVETLKIRESQIDFQSDHWEVVNHSANGFRLSRSVAGTRMAFSQLLALCPHDGEHFLLAQICWLMQEADEALIVGIAVLPGVPQGIACRVTAPGGKLEPYRPCFELPAVPAIDEKASLIVAPGTYRPDRPATLHRDKPCEIRFHKLLQRGVDFERVTYSVDS
jgi:cyclic-di-GMP-binding protein